MREKAVKNKIYEVKHKTIKAIEGDSCDKCCLMFNGCSDAPICTTDNESFIFEELEL